MTITDTNSMPMCYPSFFGVQEQDNYEQDYTFQIMLLVQLLKVVKGKQKIGQAMFSTN